MTLVLEITAGYLLGRVICDIGSSVVRVFVRRVVESSPKWQARIRADVERERHLREKVSA